MATQIPRPLSRSELSRDIKKFENEFNDPTNLLSQVLKESVANVWDVAKMENAAALVSLYENHMRKTTTRSSFIIVQLKL
jgi:hypothetical protein